MRVVIAVLAIAGGLAIRGFIPAYAWYDRYGEELASELLPSSLLLPPV